jgi:hypothetical protein
MYACMPQKLLLRNLMPFSKSSWLKGATTSRSGRSAWGPAFHLRMTAALVVTLISTAGLTENLTFLVIKEAILRNVVWMLDTKGAGFVELAYLEPSAISEYRLARTFAASPTSYRLLMFLKLFSSTARPAKTSLVEMRDALFDAHGAPPSGIAGEMA